MITKLVCMYAPTCGRMHACMYMWVRASMYLHVYVCDVQICTRAWMCLYIYQEIKASETDRKDWKEGKQEDA